MPKREQVLSGSSSDSDTEARKKESTSKKTKTAKKSKYDDTKPKADVSAVKDGKLHLSRDQAKEPKCVSVSTFKNNIYVNIRKYYYDKDLEMKPSPKGVALNVDEWNLLVNNIDEINKMIQQQ